MTTMTSDKFKICLISTFRQNSASLFRCDGLDTEAILQFSLELDWRSSWERKKYAYALYRLYTAFNIMYIVYIYIYIYFFYTFLANVSQSVQFILAQWPADDQCNFQKSPPKKCGEPRTFHETNHEIHSSKPNDKASPSKKCFLMFFLGVHTVYLYFDCLDLSKVN